MKPFTFIDIPKTATTSIHQCLESIYDGYTQPILGDNDDRRHKSLQYRLQDDQNVSNTYIFTVVRNPWSRFVSMWKYLHMVKSAVEKSPEAKERHGRHGAACVRYLSSVSDFDTHVERVYMHARFPRDLNRRPTPPIGWIDGKDLQLQKSMLVLNSDPDKIAADFILKYESLKQDWRKLCQNLEIPYTPLPIFNKSHDETPWKKFYTHRTRAIVRDLYLDDFITFGY